MSHGSAPTSSLPSIFTDLLIEAASLVYRNRTEATDRLFIPMLHVFIQEISVMKGLRVLVRVFLLMLIFVLGCSGDGFL